MSCPVGIHWGTTARPPNPLRWEALETGVLGEATGQCPAQWESIGGPALVPQTPPRWRASSPMILARAVGWVGGSGSGEEVGAGGPSTSLGVNKLPPYEKRQRPGNPPMNADGRGGRGRRRPARMGMRALQLRGPECHDPDEVGGLGARVEEWGGS